jgi:hypothetical protein
MPSIIEYWTTMPYSTCNNYLKRYTDVAALKAGIQRHAFSNGVQINIGENINDIGRFRQAIPKQKRPIAKNISEAPPPKRARIAEVFNELRIENAQVSMQIEEPQAAVVDENDQIEELQAAAVVNAPPVTAFNCVRKPLVLNGITIEVDSMTLMVNATQMCSAAGKLFKNYKHLESTETLLQELYFVMEISSVGLIFSNIGGRPELQGTWVHRYVAYDLARWISAEVFLQYTMWMDELYIENYQLLTQIEELQAAVVDALPAIAVNGARKPLVINGITIEVDPQTLIMNATQMCSAAGKLFGNYRRLDSTEQFLKELSSDIGIPILELYEKTKGGRGTSQDTWVDWRVALHLAQWLSPAVQVQVTKWIGELRIENAQVSMQIEELQAAVVDAPPAIVVVNAPPAIALNNDSPIIVAVAAPPAIAINGARKPLVLNGITIEVDPQTLMVNATQMCRAVGKLFGNYRRLDSTEEFLQELSSVIHICITGLIHTIQGGRPELQGTWVDWRVALHLAQWLSPAVQVQVTGWLGELMLTGRVELGNEMSPQQLDNAWQQRVQEEQARHQQATEALEMRHQQATEMLETRITTMERQGELAEQKTREELDAAIKTLARDTEQLPQFLDGANVLYAGYIGNWLIKYGQSSNLTRRLAEHRRHYPEFMLIKALPCDNAVASEKKLREYVAKKNIGGNYNNEKEIVCFETQEDVYKLMGAMQRSCRNKDSAVSVELKRIEIEIKRIEAEVEMKRMDVEKDKIETMRMELLMQDKITFEQYLQMK